MIRKHFKAIAEAIAIEYCQAEDFDTRVTIRTIADIFANVAESSNYTQVR